jgi:hypothetical protein
MTKTMTGIAIALATLLASPAFAQTGHADQWGGYYAYGQQDQAYDSQRVTDGRRHSPNPAWDVYNTNGRYVGSDPDPNVREMIARDHQEQLDNGF